METYLVIFASVLLIVASLGSLIHKIPDDLYCYIFEHKDWVLWKYFIKNADEFKYKYERTDGNGDTYEWGKYIAIIWGGNGRCSIHTDSECILCTFDKRHSEEMARLLKKNNGK